jgi:hypothetical protein
LCFAANVLIIATIAVSRVAERAKKLEEEQNKGILGLGVSRSKELRRRASPAFSLARVCYRKSSGEIRFIQSLNLSTTSSSGASSIASSKTTAASSSTKSAANMVCPGANSDRDGVRGPRVDLDGAAVHLHVQGCKEGRVPECGDGYPLQSTAELGNEVDGEIVGEGPAELLILELHKDGAGLRLADPDWQVAILVLDLEDYYGARAKEVQVDPIDGHLGEAIRAH